MQLKPLTAYLVLATVVYLSGNPELHVIPFISKGLTPLKQSSQQLKLQSTSASLQVKYPDLTSLMKELQRLQLTLKLPEKGGRYLGTRENKRF